MPELQHHTQVDTFTLDTYLGAGQFGEVWKATDSDTQKSVAIKFYVSLDKKGREDFFKEYQLANSLKHPNLLSASQLGEFQRRPYLVMDYCNKGTVSNLVGTLKPKDEDLIWRFVKDVAAGLAHLHAHEIVHQDIKPENILQTNDGRFVIADFGISTNVRATMRKQSGRVQNAGAVAYMAPERFKSDPMIIKASDIWSLGASMYELAIGKLPFVGHGGVMQLNGAEMPEIASKGYSKKLNDLMQKCLALEPWDRIRAEEIVEYADNVLLVRNVDKNTQKNENKKGKPTKSNIGLKIVIPKHTDTQPIKPTATPKIVTLSTKIEPEKQDDDVSNKTDFKLVEQNILEGTKTPLPHTNLISEQPTSPISQETIRKKDKHQISDNQQKFDSSYEELSKTQTSEPSKTKSEEICIIIGICLILLGIVLYGLFIHAPKMKHKNEAKNALYDYNRHISDIDTTIEFIINAGCNDYNLVESKYQRCKQQLAAADSLGQLYHDVMPDDYGKTYSLHKQLQGSIKHYAQKLIHCADEDAKYDKIKAYEDYKKAVVLDSALAIKKLNYFKRNNPIIIKDVNVANLDSTLKIINDFGSTIKAAETIKLRPKLNVHSLVSADTQLKIDIRIYRYNSTQYDHWDWSPDRYTLTITMTLAKNTDYLLLNSYGYNKVGYWSKGKVRFEFYYNGNKLGEKTITLH